MNIENKQALCSTVTISDSTWYLNKNNSGSVVCTSQWKAERHKVNLSISVTKTPFRNSHPEQVNIHTFYCAQTRSDYNLTEYKQKEGCLFTHYDLVSSGCQMMHLGLRMRGKVLFWKSLHVLSGQVHKIVTVSRFLNLSQKLSSVTFHAASWIPPRRCHAEASVLRESQEETTTAGCHAFPKSIKTFRDSWTPPLFWSMLRL